MDKPTLTLDKGTTCTAWNYSGHRLAAGSTDGTVIIYDSTDPASSNFNCTSRFKVQESSILKLVWVPPEYGDAVACITSDGTLSLWEEVSQDSDVLNWKLCKCFERNTSHVLDIQFGDSHTCLKLVAAYSDGQVKIFELLDPLELEKWQLQVLGFPIIHLRGKPVWVVNALYEYDKYFSALNEAEFQNVIDLVSKFGNASCSSASISWNPQRGELQQSSFILGFSSNSLLLNSSKIWEFDLDHQRWLPVAELASPEDKSDQVLAVAWAPNIGRPYELIAVATTKGIAIWHVGSNPDSNGRLFTEKVAVLSGHDGEVCQMEWDMSGMTLASTGSDGVVKLWQSNLNGVWHEQAILTPVFPEE